MSVFACQPLLRFIKVAISTAALLSLWIDCAPLQAQTQPADKQSDKGAQSGQGKKQGADKQKQDKTDKSKTSEDEKSDSKKPQTYLFAGQATLVWQNLFKFHSPYQGENSLRSQNEGDITNTYTL